jgi:glutathione S-transferase
MIDPTAALPVFYSFRRCPYAMRARLAMAYAQAPVEIREIELGDKPAELLAISPKGTVPVLQLTDGTVLEESLDVMRWALDQYDPDEWQGVQKNLTDELILANDTSFKKNLDRYKYHSEKSEYPKEHYRELAVEFLRHLERCLAYNEGRGLVRGTPSLADYAIFPFVRQFAGTDQAWFDAAPFPLLQVWLTTRIRSDRFALAMRKYPLWKSGMAGTAEHWAPLRATGPEGDQLVWTKVKPVAPVGKPVPYKSKAKRKDA